MRGFLMGLIKGLVVAGLGLGAASYLLPARVEAPSAQSPAAPAQDAPAAEPAAAATAAEPTPSPDPAPAAPSAAEPAAPPETAPDTAPATTAAPSEALLDPAPMPAPKPAEESEGTGAKVATPPKAGDALETPTITAEPAPEPAPAPAPAAAPSSKPLDAFAAAFAGGQGKPLFAIVIMDTGAPDIDRAVWASLPIAVSFAVDPESPTAAEAMALYRAAGREVIMLPTSLPAGAQASDVETSFAAYETLLPESVAVMSDPVSGFQDDRDLASLVVPSVGAQGRGVLLFDKGLNSAAQIAQREGIPYAMISKMIDAGGESVPVMRRYLDRAVFKAAQDGATVVMGQTLPDTLAALNEWALEGRAGDVALAPISALMKAGE